MRSETQTQAESSTLSCFRCPHYKRRLETLSPKWWYCNKVRMVVCRASGCAMIEGGWWDEVVEFLGTLSEVQSVEDLSLVRCNLYPSTKR